MKKCLLLIMLLLSTVIVLIGCHSEPEETVPTTEELVLKTIPSGTYLDSFMDEQTGRTIDYHLYVPENATENMPLVIFLHGVGAVGSPALNEENPLVYNARFFYGEEYPFLILAPTCNYSSWLSKELPQRVKDLIDYIVVEYGVDESKIIITGHSMGSSGVFRMVQLYGDYFSAAVPVSDPDVSLVEVNACLDVPIWAFAGSLENPFNVKLSSLVEKISAAGGDAMYTELVDVKHGNTPYHAFMLDLFEWALSQ